MDGFARVLIFVGVAVVIGGVLLLGASRLGLGRLPGDIAIEGENGALYIPLGSMIVISIILTIVFNVFLRR